MDKHRKPLLIPVDMRRANRSNHPDIHAGKRYLVKHDGEYFIGRFTREGDTGDRWLTFDGWEGGSLQFDAPGFNQSDWQMIWEFKI